MDLESPQPDTALHRREPDQAHAPVKFLYPSGAQPLEGYTIKRGIGRGGFGEVYFATSDAGKEVALKLIRRNLDVELRGVRHCLNLKHPHLIAIYDIRSDAVGDQWVVMEYVSGESLESVIDRHPNGMPIDEVIHWMQGIGAGVAYLHDHGIVHRDLKPGNVFLDDDAGDGGTVKIGDYGLSKFISCSRRSGQTESVGTVHYMAPEIANGRYGREIDTYALGIILYEMLTGHVPFEGESVGEVLMKHLTAEPDLASLEPPFREIVERTLAKDPEVRIGSVGELLARLPGATHGGTAKAQEKIDGWSAQHASPDGIGGDHLFADTSVRGTVNGATARAAGGLPGDREPLYHWVSTTWGEMVDGWHQWSAHPVFKALVLFALVGLAVTTLPAWGGMAFGLGLVYLFYYLFWSVFLRPAQRSRSGHRRTNAPDPQVQARAVHRQAEEHRTEARKMAEEYRQQALGAAGAASAHQPPATRRQQAAARRQLRMNWKQKVHQQLATKSFRQRASDLLTSMVLSGVLCAFLSVLAVLLVGSISAADRSSLYLWLTGVSTLGSWVVLATARFTEGRFEDQVPMRMWQLTGGALTGTLAWFLAQMLLIGLPHNRDVGVQYRDTLMQEVFGLHESDFITWHGQHAAAPDLLMTIVYFSLMMVMIRWWRLAEYTRGTRLSLVSVGLCIAGAWIAHLVCWYPQPAGVVVAGLVAISTQLVSPWLAPSQRKALADQAVAA